MKNGKMKNGMNKANEWTREGVDAAASKPGKEARHLDDQGRSTTSHIRQDVNNIGNKIKDGAVKVENKVESGLKKAKNKMSRAPRKSPK